MTTTTDTTAAVWEMAHLVEDFKVHGVHAVSNCGGYEIEISDDGETARVRTTFHSDPAKNEVSNWLPIVDVNDPADEDTESIPVIDPEGLYIPLSAVMRV